MSKRNIIRIVFLGLALLTVCFVSASAQEIDIYSLSYEELAELTALIVNKMQQKTEPAAAGVSLIGSEPENGSVKSAVYTNKKLVIEVLPTSMFVQKKQPEKEAVPGNGDIYLNAGELIGTPCGNSPECKWKFDNGELYCSCGHLVP